jgi:hypothetical protein
LIRQMPWMLVGFHLLILCDAQKEIGIVIDAIV